jgi:putative transposase
MARKPRFILPGEPQHIIVRGVNRCPIFIEDKDYVFYLNRLLEATHKYNCQLHAYVLMKNHVHLLLTPKDRSGPGKAIQNIGRYYVRYFNFNYRRTGTLWEGRYKSSLVDSDEYLMTCYKYIELNPVRAGFVDKPEQYQWSSFHYNALGKYDSLVVEHDKYKALGKDKHERQSTYRNFCGIEIDKSNLKEIRYAANSEWPLGNDEFRKKISEKFKRRTKPLPPGGDRKSSEYQLTLTP